MTRFRLDSATAREAMLLASEASYLGARTSVLRALRAQRLLLHWWAVGHDPARALGSRDVVAGLKLLVYDQFGARCRAEFDASLLTADVHAMVDERAEMRGWYRYHASQQRFAEDELFAWREWANGHLQKDGSSPTLRKGMDQLLEKRNDDWRPIETAPRHTWCLVWFNHVAWEARLAGGGWRAPSDTELYPTHWRPMPEGPR